MLQILESSPKKKGVTPDGCPIYLNFVMFSIWRLLTWEALVKVEVACDEISEREASAFGGPKNRTAWLSGRMREEEGTGDLVCERPVGEEAADP